MAYNFCVILFAFFVNQTALEMGSTIKGKILLLRGKFFPCRVDPPPTTTHTHPLTREMETVLVASVASIFIPLKILNLKGIIWNEYWYICEIICFCFSLSISGKKVRAIIPPVEARSRNSGTPSTQLSEYSHLEEEIFEKEGEYEEIIAVDYKDM